MIESNKPAKSTPAAPAREAIPVRRLKFVRNVDVPGRNATEGVIVKDEKNRDRWEVSFMPWLRSFEIRFYAGGKAEHVAAFVPEAQVAIWEPA